MKTLTIIIILVFTISSTSALNSLIGSLVYNDPVIMRCPDICPQQYQPRCASGASYANPCEVKCENDKRQAMGHVPLDVTCTATCNTCRKRRRKINLHQHYEKFQSFLKPFNMWPAKRT